MVISIFIVIACFIFTLIVLSAGIGTVCKNQGYIIELLDELKNDLEKNK